jgi:aminopeptidase
MIKMDSLKKAAGVVLKNCMKLQKGEKCLIITDSKREDIGKAFLDEALKITDNSEIEIIPVGRVNGEEPPAETAEKMKMSDVIIMPTTNSLSWTHARANATKKGARIASMPGITKEIMAENIDVDYEDLKKSTTSLYKKLKGKGKITIATEKGTSITLSVKGREWHGDDAGVYDQPGAWGNLPSGEIYTAPVLETVNGTLVVDASMAGVGKLEDSIKIKIENGYAVEITGGEESERFKKLLNDVKDKNAFAVAELGIGTNKKAKITGEVLVDEKAYGTAHIAFGSNKAMGGTIDVAIHVDGIFKNPTITADGEIIIKDGELL